MAADPLVRDIAGAVHAVGFIGWVTGLFTMSYLLGQIPDQTADEFKARLAAINKRAAIMADVGATLAILAGLHMLFAYRVFAEPWMHVKLLLIAILVIVHVYLRRETGKAARGGSVSVGPMLPIVLLVVMAIVVLAKLKPFV